MIITLGSLLERISNEPSSDARFQFLMPSTRGPCRFGVYHLLHRIVLERAGWHERVRLWSPVSSNYFEGLPAGFSALLLAGVASMDALLGALHHTRLIESRPEAAIKVYEQARTALLRHLRRAAASADLGARSLTRELVSGSLLGLPALLRQAAVELAAIAPGSPGIDHQSHGSGTFNNRSTPIVALVGEIYLRCDPFANDRAVDKLEQRGIRAHLAPASEWIEYTDLIKPPRPSLAGAGSKLGVVVRRRVLNLVHEAMAEPLGWPSRISAADAVRAAHPLVRSELRGEAVLTVGTALQLWRHGEIDGVVAVAPLECMPGKIAEAQLLHASRQLGFPFLALNLHGDPISTEQLDTFAFDVHRLFRRRVRSGVAGSHRDVEPPRQAPGLQGGARLTEPMVRADWASLGP